MFTSQRLKAVPAPGAVEVHEQRLDDVVHQMLVRGSLTGTAVADVARRLDGALQAGVRWLILDLSGAAEVSDPMLHVLVATARECRERRGEVIVTGASAEVAARLSAFDPAERPALAATVDQAVVILKMLRPKTRLGGSGAEKRRTSLTLPRIEPRPTS
jgi:anti-anti-sigma regulatory factor